MNKLRLLLILSLLCGLLPAQTTYHLVVDEWPPYSTWDGKVASGMDIDVLNAVATRLGLRFEFEFVPWSRALRMVQEGAADGILSLYDTTERRAFLKYPSAPLNEETIVVAYPTSSPLKRPLQSLADLTGLSVGVTQDTSYGTAFDAATNFRRDVSVDSETGLRKLQAGRMDVMVINRFNFLAKAMGDAAMATKVKLDPFVVNSDKLYVAFSLEALKKKPIPVDKISATLAALRKDGTIAKIYEKYLGK